MYKGKKNQMTVGHMSFDVVKSQYLSLSEISSLCVLCCVHLCQYNALNAFHVLST